MTSPAGTCFSKKDFLRRAVCFPAALALFWAAPYTPPQMARAQIKVDVKLVLLDATVKDKAGHVLTDLKKENFLLSEDGQPRDIAHFSQDELPLAVALVVQQNSWVQPFMRPLHYATLSILKALKPEDQIALFAFNDDVDRLVDLTYDKSKVAEAIDFQGKGAGTNINDAVYQAAKYLRETAPAARRVILLISDNMPAECKKGVDHEKVLQTVLESDAAVYSLKLPYRGPAGMSIANKMFEHWLISVSKLTADSAGEIIDLEKEGSLYLAFQTILTRLKTRYTLGFYPVRTIADEKFHVLGLQLAPSFGQKGRDYLVLVKTGYYATLPSVAAR
jgi:Ca-activated chloride channel family protein